MKTAMDQQESWHGHFVGWLNMLKHVLKHASTWMFSWHHLTWSQLGQRWFHQRSFHPISWLTIDLHWSHPRYSSIFHDSLFSTYLSDQWWTQLAKPHSFACGFLAISESPCALLQNPFALTWRLNNNMQATYALFNNLNIITYYNNFNPVPAIICLR